MCHLSFSSFLLDLLQGIFQSSPIHSGRQLLSAKLLPGNATLPGSILHSSSLQPAARTTGVAAIAGKILRRCRDKPCLNDGEDVRPSHQHGAQQAQGTTTQGALPASTPVVLLSAQARASYQHPPVIQRASQLNGTCSKLYIPPALQTAWKLFSGKRDYRVEMDGELQPTSSRSCAATLQQADLSLHTWMCLPDGVISCLAGSYFRGLRLSLEKTLVLMLSNTACSLLTLEQCMVSACSRDVVSYF